MDEDVMAVATDSRTHGLRVGASGNGAAVFWLLLAVVSALPLFHTGFVGLATAWATPEYSHGPIIPMLSFYMFLREMKAVPPPATPVTDRWPGMLVILLALLIALLGNLVAVDDIVFYGLIIWIYGLVLTGFGLRRGWVFWVSVLHLVLMLPLPNFIEWKLTLQLQFISSEIGVRLVRAAGVPVYLDGNVIDLGTYKLLVAEACSGLRYLFPIMSFSYVFAVLYRGPVWHKLALLLAAAPLAVLMNSVRIGIIGILVDRFGISQAEGFLHFFEGWVIFLSCIGLLFLLAVVLQRLTPNPRPLAEAIDLDFSGLGAQLRRGLAVAPSAALIAAALTTTALAAAWLAVPTRPLVEVEREPFGLFPLRLGEWTGRPEPLAPTIEQVLAADDYVNMDFLHPAEAAPVSLFAAYYRTQSGGAGIHSPEVCLPADGWEIFAIEPVEVALSGAAGDSIPLNRAVIQKGLDKQLVYYWFESGGERSTNDMLLKLRSIAATLTRGRTDAALVRVVTPIGPDGEAAADARLTRFLEASVDRLRRNLPEE
jgi:exosortase D (VPLPA-CTERM-specific)